MMLQDILVVVSNAYNLTPEQLKEHTRRRDIVRPRQIVMWIARHATKLSLPDIGQRLGGYDHTTVMHGVNIIEKMMEDDPEYAKHVRWLTKAADTRSMQRQRPLPQKSIEMPASA